VKTRFKIAVVTVLLIASVFAWALYDTLSNINAGVTRNACDNALTADFFKATSRALGAPPAPNPERAAATKDMVRTARRVGNADLVCAKGIPKPLTPTPVEVAR
jgi:hypothetical protein